MSRIAIVVSDEGLGGVTPLGHTLQALGFIPILITGPVSNTKIEAWRSIYSQVEIIDALYNPDTLVDTALSLANGRPLSAMITCYDGLVVPVAYAAVRLNLSHPALPGLELARNKYLCRWMTSQQHLATPRFSLVKSVADCRRAGTLTGFPAIIKPLNGVGSHLVFQVDSLAALETAYIRCKQGIVRTLRGNYTHLPGQNILITPDEAATWDADHTFLVEEMLQGHEFSAEIIMREGIFFRVALFHKFIVDKHGFLECGFTSPPLEIGKDAQEQIWCTIEQYLRALGIDEAVANIEIMYTSSGPVLVEANVGRAGGQILVKAVRQLTGIDLLLEIVAAYSGLPRPEPQKPTFTGQITTLTIFPPTSGILERIDGLQQVKSLPGVVEVILFCHPGDYIDVQDIEFFAVNLLVHGIVGRTNLEALYQEANKQISFVMKV